MSQDEPSCLCPLGEDCAQRVRDAKSPGYLLIGHGTRNEAGTEEFFALTRLLKERFLPNPVEACFLELNPPTIDEAWDRLVAGGVDCVIAIPLLLFSAGHAKRDIPEALTGCCKRTVAALGRQVCFVQTTALESNPTLLELSALRAKQAIKASGLEIDPSRTALIVVGRGSLDDSATAQMYRFSELRGQRERAAVVRTGFIAMAQPKLTEVLEQVGRLPDIDTVIVQPHLLFQGDLNHRIGGMIDAAEAMFPDRRWIRVGHLGPDPLLSDAVFSLASHS